MALKMLFYAMNWECSQLPHMSLLASSAVANVRWYSNGVIRSMTATVQRGNKHMCPAPTTVCLHIWL